MRWLINVRLPNPSLAISETDVWGIHLNDNEIIESVVPISDALQVSGEDWQGDFLSPMGIDLQINGGLGLAFPELTFNDLPKLFSLLDLLWKDGVEAIAPTIVTCSISSLRQALLVFREARKRHVQNRCKLLGAHLEGPFLSKSFLGAHNQEYLVDPSLEALEQRIGDFENEIALMTLAPELKGSQQVIAQLKKVGIVVALGHSAADETIVNFAFDQGVTMLTHSFNAMAPLHHRFPGPVVEAIINGKISLGLISDGIHVHPKVAVILQRLAPNKVVLVSDAISPYGLQDGRYPWDKRMITVNKGDCRLEDGTLAGSTLSLLEGCKKLATWSGQAGNSIWSATMAPRQVLSEEKLIMKEFLIGKKLSSLLRWETNPETQQLFWHLAA